MSPLAVSAASPIMVTRTAPAPSVSGVGVITGAAEATAAAATVLRELESCACTVSSPNPCLAICRVFGRQDPAIGVDGYPHVVVIRRTN
ncbi:hypothetical protein BDN71DRAFT_1248746 [Pleurotus eryngii]|uniref:Uncharacterized protein n=1 Tax=Pleurotus eryngii TaxID=5323 RepID=A0A9P5ZQ76_PLEER|nr:hypothetical protein BDN71DRAFT_1248746 [Pleurotus eryngii]